MKYIFGVDLGGTTVKMGLFEEKGLLLSKWEIPTRKEDHGAYIIPDIAESLNRKMEEYEISSVDVVGIGIGVPAPVVAGAYVNSTANLGWGYMHVKNELENRTGLPVHVANDANVAALGESWKGAAAGNGDIIMVTLGTGVGGGIVVNGKILDGVVGAGGEIGHIFVNPNETETCGCGKKGCLEQYASATGIVRLAKRHLAAVTEDSVLRHEEISAKTVFDAVKEGDAVACQIAEQFGTYLGNALANICTIINPGAIVIGGGVSKAGQVLIPYIEKNFRDYTFHANENISIVLATLGNDAGIYGAAKMML
jgi:glucokinase